MAWILLIRHKTQNNQSIINAMKCTCTSLIHRTSLLDTTHHGIRAWIWKNTCFRNFSKKVKNHFQITFCFQFLSCIYLKQTNFSHFLHEFHWLSQAIKHNGWCEQILQHVHVIVHVLAFNEKKMRVACDFVVNFLWEWWIRLEFLIEQMSIFDKKCM